MSLASGQWLGIITSKPGLYCPMGYLLSAESTLKPPMMYSTTISVMVHMIAITSVLLFLSTCLSNVNECFGERARSDFQSVTCFRRTYLDNRPGLGVFSINPWLAARPFPFTFTGVDFEKYVGLFVVQAVSYRKCHLCKSREFGCWFNGGAFSLT